MMDNEVRCVVLINVDPDEQEIRIEVWRNERMTEGQDRIEGVAVGAAVPTRVQEVVVAKKEEYKGVQEESDQRHYTVRGGPLRLKFADFFIEEAAGSEFLRARFAGRKKEGDWDFVLGEEELASEAADLWFADGTLVNDWREGLVNHDDDGGNARPA